MGAHDFFKGKTILVTGGAGSIGSELVRKLLQYDPRAIRIMDVNESGLFDLEQELHSKAIRLFVGDVRDKGRLYRAFEGVDVVFHAAALKHVPICEYNPFDAIKTNVLGTQNVLDAVLDMHVGKFVLISTDKAVNPTNVMGATKLLAERLTISANYYKGNRPTVLSCVRFGNVIGSRGSVVPLFRKQIERREPITVTDPDMTRFTMSIPKAVDLILKATELSRGGEIFILKMPALRIGDLADAILDRAGDRWRAGDVRIIGRRLGEKMYEELIATEEQAGVYEDDEMFVILPQEPEYRENIIRNLPRRFTRCTDGVASSSGEKQLTKEEIKLLLAEIGF